ncbi:MAG: type IX secretion system membrane protein PorP/SprF, partial [Flavobacteriaceae bacterium]|nr:type IX secretion system membrane protein PorP/SprF [Flavobacteriaceae bacterium]
EDGLYEIEPSIYFKLFESDSRSITDLNVKGKRITDDGYYWAGFSTRFINDQSFEPLAIVPMLGLKKQDFYVGYAFQYNINEANELNHGGTHMLTLGYDFESNRGSSRW